MGGLAEETQRRTESQREQRRTAIPPDGERRGPSDILRVDAGHRKSDLRPLGRAGERRRRS